MMLMDGFVISRMLKLVSIVANIGTNDREMALEKKQLNKKIVEYLNQNTIEFYNTKIWRSIKQHLKKNTGGIFPNLSI